jgi:hypothetical protein
MQEHDGGTVAIPGLMNLDNTVTDSDLELRSSHRTDDNEPSACT